MTKYRQLKPSTFILYELIVIQGSSTQIMGHREAQIMMGSGRGLLGKTQASLSDACVLGPPKAPRCLPRSQVFERWAHEARRSVPSPGDQIPREALPSWGLEGTDPGTPSVKGHPTSHSLCHMPRGLSEFPEAVSFVLMPPAGVVGDPESIRPRAADSRPSYRGLDRGAPHPRRMRAPFLCPRVQFK